MRYFWNDGLVSSMKVQTSVARSLFYSFLPSLFSSLVSLSLSIYTDGWDERANERPTQKYVRCAWIRIQKHHYESISTQSNMWKLSASSFSSYSLLHHTDIVYININVRVYAHNCIHVNRKYLHSIPNAFG